MSSSYYRTQLRMCLKPKGGKRDANRQSRCELQNFGNAPAIQVELEFIQITWSKTLSQPHHRSQLRLGSSGLQVPYSLGCGYQAV